MVRIKAAAPIKLGKTSGIGRTTFQNRLPGRSHRDVNQANSIPKTAVVNDTETARTRER